MKSVLIVEDNQRKLEKLRDFMSTEFPQCVCEERMSYNSANKEIAINHEKYDLILLDMSMQTFDISDDESGGDPEPLAGRNILSQIYLRDIKTKVIVVTMYENYVDGTKLKLLDQELRQEYSENYCGYIFFSHNNTDWYLKLKTLIKVSI